MSSNCSTTTQQVAWRCYGSVSSNVSLLPGFTVSKLSPPVDFWLLSAVCKVFAVTPTV